MGRGDTDTDEYYFASLFTQPPIGFKYEFNVISVLRNTPYTLVGGNPTLTYGFVNKCTITNNNTVILGLTIDNQTCKISSAPQVIISGTIIECLFIMEFESFPFFLYLCCVAYDNIRLTHLFCVQ